MTLVSMDTNFFDKSDMEKAQEMFAKFCVEMASDAGQARSTFIARIQLAMRDARDDGIRIGLRARQAVEATQDHR